MKAPGLSGPPLARRALGAAGLALLALTTTIPGEAPPARAGAPATRSPWRELVPGLDWRAWYAQQAGYTPHPLRFGAYVTLGVADQLYVGLGTAAPTEADGAYLARVDGSTLVAIGALQEQGLHDMAWGGGALHVAGTDPCCGLDWSAGNHYVYVPPGPIVRYRDATRGLPDVIHTWGLWIAPDLAVYVATSRQAPTVSGSKGSFFRSADAGATWNLLTDLGSWRTYDVRGHDGRLYAVYQPEFNGPAALGVSEDGGRHWTDVVARVAPPARLAEFGPALLVVSADRRSLLAVTGSGVERFDLPAGVRIASGYHVLAPADAYLYAIWTQEDPGGTAYSVARTADLRSWQTVALAGGRPLISLSYWPARRWVVVGSSGPGAGVWRLAVGGAERGEGRDP